MMTDKNTTDWKPTIADFQKKIWDIKEISEEYKVFLPNSLEEIINEGNIIFLPQPTYQPNRKEAILLHDSDSLIYLEKQHNKEIIKYEIEYKQVIGVCVKEDLLVMGYKIFWLQDNKLTSLDIPFNTSREELFSPFLNRMLGIAADFNCYSMSSQRPEKLKQEQYALYNYSVAAFRLGALKDEWQWWNIKKTGMLIWRKKVQSACLQCNMERGQMILSIKDTQVDTWYLLKDYWRTEFVPENQYQTLTISACDQQVHEIRKIIPHKK